MDPNATLVALRTLAAKITEGNYSSGMATAIAVDADNLASAVRALDAWIMSGGFLPTQWER